MCLPVNIDLLSSASDHCGIWSWLGSGCTRCRGASTGKKNSAQDHDCGGFQLFSEVLEWFDYKSSEFIL